MQYPIFSLLSSFFQKAQMELEELKAAAALKANGEDSKEERMTPDKVRVLFYSCS